MQVDQLKRWHWALIGIIVGLMIAYVRLGVEPDNPISMSPNGFANEVGDDIPNHPGSLIIKDIVLHPPSDANESAYKKSVQIVTFKRAVYDEQLKGYVYKPAALKVELPFQLRRGSSDSYNGKFIDYMKALQDENSAIKFHYAWWEEPRNAYLLWAGGCLVVIGGIWPTIINLMVGAGFGPQKKAEDYDLDRFGKGKKTDSVAPSGRREMTEDERQQLAGLTAKYEGDLAPNGVVRTAAAVVTSATEQPVKKLESKPLEIANIEQEKEDKEYKGEFYPVAKAGQKKADNS
ncbi:MAG TPA: hypothetical protein VGG19_02515 [Tepidisphaeraceae bacterium]|jgi:hypothetical protein